VLKTDLKDHFVSAQKDTFILKDKLIAQPVTINVTLVPAQLDKLFIKKIMINLFHNGSNQLNIVTFVPKIPSDSMPQLVNVSQVTMKKPVKPSVKDVDGNVSPVKDLLITVLIVKKTELMLKFQNVHVHSTMDSMKLKNKLIAHLVIQLVKPV
jgi:hypothetical protein